jgi:hypothetical protein
VGRVQTIDWVCMESSTKLIINWVRIRANLSMLPSPPGAALSWNNNSRLLRHGGRSLHAKILELIITTTSTADCCLTHVPVVLYPTMSLQENN